MNIYATVTGCDPSAGDMNDLMAGWCQYKTELIKARQLAPFDIMGCIAASHKCISRPGTISPTPSQRAERGQIFPV